MLTEPNSFNGKIILEAYEQTEIKTEKHLGWITPGQKSNLKGLRVLVQATLQDGTVIPTGSTAYIKEETLHNQPWAKNRLKSDTLKGEFILATMNDIEYIFSPKRECCMTIGRLGIHSPHHRFEIIKGSCGCLLVYTPIGTFTWFDKNCKCDTCEQYECECICQLCNKDSKECICEKFK